jgi:hypothetical protein
MNRVDKRKKRRMTNHKPTTNSEGNKPATNEADQTDRAPLALATIITSEANPITKSHNNQAESKQSNWRRVLNLLKEHTVNLVSLAAAVLAATAADFAAIYTYKQANIAERALVSGQRAFVYLDKIEAKWLDTKTADPGMVVNVTFQIENSGNTPSRDLRIVAGCYPLGPEIPREPFSVFRWDDKRAAHLFIGAHQILDFPGCRLPEREIDPFQSNPFIQGRCLMGEIRYFDTVSDPPIERITQFSYQLVFHSFSAKASQLDYETLLVGNHNCSEDDCKNAKGDPGVLAAPRWATY